VLDRIGDGASGFAIDSNKDRGRPIFAQQVGFLGRPSVATP
jgi:hypothetical protein